MQKVLIITYYWPPAGGPGVQRWLKFVKYLRDFEVEPVVYVPENPHYPIIDKSFEAEINFIDPVLNSSTRTVTVRAELTNKNNLLKPGMFVTAKVKNENENSKSAPHLGRAEESGCRIVGCWPEWPDGQKCLFSAVVRGGRPASIDPISSARH